MGEKYYIFVGCAEGRFEIQDGKNKGEMHNFANMFVISPVSDYESADYHASGSKAEKLKCISPDVWKDLTPGELCTLYFTDKKVVALATSVGRMIDLVDR